jgi:hypothetical protein
MKTPKVGTVRAYPTLVGILAALLLTLPASAADWKTLAPMPAGRDMQR